jgi:hypothetical protein
MNEEPTKLHQAIEQAQREQREWDQKWGKFVGASGPSKWTAIFATIGIFVGVMASADAGGWVTAISGIIGCVIGYLIPICLRFFFITLPENLWYRLRRLLRGSRSRY